MGGSGEAGNDPEDRDDDPRENGKIPAEGFRDSGKTVGRNGCADVGAGIQESRIGRNLSALDKAFWNHGDQHKINPVHAGNDRTHKEHGNDDVACKESHHVQNQSRRGGENKDHAGAKDLILKDRAVKFIEHREADDAEDGKHNRKRNRAFLGHNFGEGFGENAGHPGLNAVTKHALQNNTEHNQGDGEVNEARNGEAFLGLGRIVFCRRIARICNGVGEKARVNEHPEHHNRQTAKGTEKHHHAPRNYLQEQRAEEVEKDRCERRSPRNAHGGVAIFAVGQIDRHQAHDRWPKHRMRKAVDRPNNRHGMDGGAKKHGKVTNGGKRESHGEKQLRLDLIPHQAADDLTCSVGDRQRGYNHGEVGFFHGEVGADLHHHHGEVNSH